MAEEDKFKMKGGKFNFASYLPCVEIILSVWDSSPGEQPQNHLPPC